MNSGFNMPDCSGFLNHCHLEELAQPAHEALLELVRSHSSPHVRTTVVTALMMSIWQYANKDISPIKPSVILVNTTGNSFDPIMAVMDALLDRKNKLDNSHRKVDGYVGTPEKARESMSITARLVRAERRPFVDRKEHEDFYHKARRTAYGLGSIHNYAEAWHPELGLVTGQSDATTLLVDVEKDKALFREHLLNDPGKLSSPSGTGMGLENVWKTMQVSAALLPSECDEIAVDAIMQLGSPYIILPHLVDDFINIPNVHAISHYVNILRRNWNTPVESSPFMPNNGWHQSYQEHLWGRLGRLPVAYRYPIIELVHRLENICNSLAEYAGLTAGGVTPENLAHLKSELYAHSLRGITLSITALSWYGLGLVPVCPLQTTRKLLCLLREKGSMSLRDVQRSIGYKTASERDAAVKCLRGDGLLQQEGKIISAVTYPDYIRGLSRRHGLPHVPDLSMEDPSV